MQPNEPHASSMDVKLIHDASATIKVRQHRGTLHDSMLTQIEIPATKEALVEYVREQYPVLHTLLRDTDCLKFDPAAFDERIGQNVIYVSLNADLPQMRGVLAIVDNIPMSKAMAFNEVRYARSREKSISGPSKP